MNKWLHTFMWEEDLLELSQKKEEMQIKNENVFYYTSTETLRKIIENGCIFASHIKYMNDWQEFDNGYACISAKIIERMEFFLKDLSLSEEMRSDIKDIINFFKQGSLSGYFCKIWTNDSVKEYEFGRGYQFYDYAFPQVYNISFTHERDLLSQWKMYASESGVAIEFDFNKSNIFAQKVAGDYVFKEKCFPQKVTYLKEQNIGDIPLSGLDDEETIDSGDLIRNLKKVPFIKNKYYSAEDESRLVFRPYRDEQKEIVSDVKFRESNHVLIPYLEIFCLADEGDKVCWPIISLTIGPGNNQDVVFSSLIYFIESVSKNIYDFTVSEYIDNFERYYDILIHKLQINVWKTKNGIIIDSIIKRFRDSMLIQYNNTIDDDVEAGICRISEICYTGKFREELQKAKDSIYRIIKKEISLEEKEDAEQIVRQFEEDYYLATNGIIIQKSKAPYIFN